MAAKCKEEINRIYITNPPRTKFNLFKFWIFLAILYGVLKLGVCLAYPESEDSIFQIPNYVFLSSPFLLVVLSALISVIFTIVAYLVYYFLDSNSKLENVVAFLIGGIVFTVYLIIARWIYRKLNLKFLN